MKKQLIAAVLVPLLLMSGAFATRIDGNSTNSSGAWFNFLTVTGAAAIPNFWDKTQADGRYIQTELDPVWLSEKVTYYTGAAIDILFSNTLAIFHNWLQGNITNFPYNGTVNNQFASMNGSIALHPFNTTVNTELGLRLLNVTHTNDLTAINTTIGKCAQNNSATTFSSNFTIQGTTDLNGTFGTVIIVPANTLYSIGEYGDVFVAEATKWVNFTLPPAAQEVGRRFIIVNNGTQGVKVQVVVGSADRIIPGAAINYNISTTRGNSTEFVSIGGVTWVRRGVSN
jgi:hypothetical protein